MTLQDWEVAPTAQQTESVPWVHDWEVPGFAARQLASASTDPSYLRHCTARDWAPFPFLVQEDAVRVWVPPPQAAEQVDQAEYDHVPVSPEHEPHEPMDQEFATQEEPFQEYQEAQA